MPQQDAVRLGYVRPNSPRRVSIPPRVRLGRRFVTPLWRSQSAPFPPTKMGTETRKAASQKAAKASLSLLALLATIEATF